MPAASKSLVPSAVLDLLFPPDPGGLRLLAALRATLAGVLAFLVALLLGALVQAPITDRILGFAIGLFIAASVRDGVPRQQLITIALAPLAAFAATALAALLLRQPLAGAIAVPPLMFLVAYGAARGPRYAALGMIGLIAYIVGLVSRQPPDTLPIRLVVLVFAAGAAALIRFVLLPERPEAELDRLRRAVHAGIGDVLDRIAAAVAAGAWTGPARAGLRRDIHRLGDIVMLAQARVATLAVRPAAEARLGGRWLHLLAVELGVERAARVALEDLGPPADRARLLAALEALRRGTEAPQQPSAGRLAAALALLERVLRETPRAGPAPLGASPQAAAAPGLRPAFQTAIAAALAIVAGDLLSNNRWYWSAFAAFVMFQGTRSRGESLAKGLQFMVGTLAGVLVGIVAATLLSGHEILTMAAIVIAVFLAFQANVTAYGVMMFWITIIIGLMFGMLGYFTPDLLVLRLEETAAGAACGALVASLVLVRREGAATQDATVGFLRALGQEVDGAAGALLDGAPGSDLAARILTAEQRFRDLTALSHIELSGHLASRNEGLRRRMLVLEACEQWARELGQIALQAVRLDEPLLARSARQATARIGATLPCMIERLANPAAVPSIADEPAADLGEAPEDEPAYRAARLLLRIDAALVHINTRLGRSAIEPMPQRPGVRPAV